MNKLIISLSALLISTILYSQNPPEIIQQPFSPVYQCVGDSKTIVFEVQGSEPLSYQWFKGGEILPGENSNSLHFPSFTVEDSGEYFCEVSNEFGTVNTNPVNIMIIEFAPDPITVSSQHLLLCPGSNNLLTASPAGSGNSFTWYLDGNVVGYTPTYSINNASVNDEGDYHCVAQNACGSVISDTISLTYVHNLASIVQPPQNQSICEGEDAIFTAEVAGDFLFFQWLQNGSMIPGEYSDSLVISGLTYPHQSATYQLVIQNICNSDTSNSVYINVNNMPVITGHPLNAQKCVGEEHTLNATATGSTTPEYQWYDQFGILENETNNQLSITVQEEEYYYHCLITNVCGTKSTDTAVITPLLPIEITEQPEDSVLCSGDDITLAIKANGTGPITYHWFFNYNDIVSPNITGVNETNLNITGINTGQEGVYHCIVTNVCGTVSSDTVFLTVNTMPQIYIQPTGAELCEEEELNISFTFVGSEPMTSEWFSTELQTPVWEEPDLFLESSYPEFSGDYYCVLTNSCGMAITDTISINILSFPEIVQHPNDVGVCVGEQISLSIEATGSEPLHYLWYRNGSPLSTQTQPEIIYQSATIANSGEYFCQVLNQCKTVYSDTISVEVGTPPVITWSPFDQNLCEGDSLTMFMNYFGDFVNLQWYHNDMPVSGANDTVLVIPNASLQNGGIYYCMAYNACDSVYTLPAYINIEAAPQFSLGPDVSVCEGETVYLAPDDEFQNYNWNNGLSFQHTLEVNESGTYTLVVIGNNGCQNSQSVIVQFHPYHDIIINQDTIISCGELHLNAGEGAYSYFWSTGETESHYITVTQTGQYSVTATGDAFGCESEKSIYVEIRDPVNISLGPDITEPVNSFVNIGVEAIYDTYMWNTGFSGPVLTVFGSEYGVGTHMFWLLVHAENGCYDADTINVIFTPANNIENTESDKLFSVYPNPATNFFNIEVFDFEKAEGFKMYNSAGENVKSEFLNGKQKHTVNVEMLPGGLYFIKLYNKKGEYFISKIIIQ